MILVAGADATGTRLAIEELVRLLAVRTGGNGGNGDCLLASHSALSKRRGREPEAIAAKMFAVLVFAHRAVGRCRRG